MYGHEGICSIFGKEWQISQGCKCLIKGLSMVVLGYRRNIYGFTLLHMLGSLCRFCGRAAVHGNVLALSLLVQMMHFLEGHQSRSTGTVEESMFSAKEEQWSCCVFPAIPTSLPFPVPSAASVLYHYSVCVLALWIDISFYAGRHLCLDKGCPEICRKTSAGFTFFPWKYTSTVLVPERNVWVLIYWALYCSMWIMKLKEKLQVICT